uniref:Uncharacterized protein n=1 Tax=Sphaeramia orbicularis TaxID=375764 RepID=A0A673CJL5_9TELE
TEVSLWSRSGSQLLSFIFQCHFLNDDHSPPCFICLRKFCPYMGFQPAATTEKNKAGSSDSNQLHSCKLKVCLCVSSLFLCKSK